MLVNELARKADVQPHVVRYYSRIGLLQPRRNSENGYQVFGSGDLARLDRIHSLQALGFSLAEIKRFFERVPDCETMRAGLERNLARTRRKLAELRALQQRMEEALQSVGGPDCCSAFCAGACRRAPPPRNRSGQGPS